MATRRRRRPALNPIPGPLRPARQHLLLYGARSSTSRFRTSVTRPFALRSK